MKNAPFLAALETAVTELRNTAQASFVPLDAVLLNQRPAPTNWSILECLEHLNRYSRYYNAAFAKALARPTNATADEVQYSWLGRKSVDMMRPTNAKKSNTLKHLNPLGSRLGHEVLAEFDQHQAQLLALLAQAARADLNRRAVPVEFFRLLKLRLGEALEFVVVHQQRHVQQARRVQAALRAELAC
ncbi:DinB family protein [Hymenobacter sp. BT523]|uniref:DinB family protein n=1 Tax=Hymenobacter sp. BT523 TaxID=2795725 RepID=UPI0018EBA127|nr:DinB family protein [Hymenobacter sp. BT523]MBJ6109953.1 DinB family protein [Hymenobacter sp. BT523]